MQFTFIKFNQVYVIAEIYVSPCIQGELMPNIGIPLAPIGSPIGRPPNRTCSRPLSAPKSAHILAPFAPFLGQKEVFGICNLCFGHIVWNCISLGHDFITSH